MRQSFWNFTEKNWEITRHLQKIAQHYESTVKMAFFICFRSILAVLAAILKMSVLGICHALCPFSKKNDYIVIFKCLQIQKHFQLFLCK